MKIECGGSLILGGPNDIYGIQSTEFNNTYASTGRDKTACLEAALALLGISKEEFIEAQQVATNHPTLDDESNDKIEGNDVPNL